MPIVSHQECARLAVVSVVTFALHQLELAHVCPGELVDDAVHLGAGTSLHVAHHAGHVELELVLRHSNNININTPSCHFTTHRQSSLEVQLVVRSAERREKRSGNVRHAKWRAGSGGA